MPILKSAIKKLRQDKKRQKLNEGRKNAYKKAIGQALEKKSSQTVSLAFQAVDRAVKHKLMHKNRAARIKARLSRLSKKSK